MTALPLAPFCIRIRVIGKFNNAPIAHIMHAQYAGGTPSNTDLASYATSFRNAFNTRFASQLPTTASYSLFEVIDLASLTGALGSNNVAVTGTATAGGNSPNSAAAVVSWKVGLRYRGGHPRTYFPYSSSATLANGNTLPSTFVTSLSGAANNFLTDVNAITSGTLSFAFCMVSYYHGKVLRPVGLPFNITSAQVHNRLDSQRRRLGKEF